MKIADLLKKRKGTVITIRQDRSVYDAIKILFENNIGAVLVKDDNDSLAGIVSERDILRECYRNIENLKAFKIKDMMTTNLFVGESEDDLSHVKTVMVENRIRHLPVLENENLIGILSMRDIVEAELLNTQLENRQLKEMMKGKDKTRNG